MLRRRMASRRIVECGRVEVKGAVVRFKERGTLEASDRNLGELERVFVRTTPSPELRLFADLIFAGHVFRVWQDQSLINYKEFLEKVAFAGPENFRSFVRYVTQASPDTILDATSRNYADAAAPAERFVNKDELADYDRALTRGDAAAAARRAPAAAAAAAGTEPSTAEKQKAVEAAWQEMAPALEEDPAADTQRVGKLLGGALLALGVILGAGALRVLLHVMSLNEEKRSTAFVGVVAAGGLAAVAFLALGVIYLRRASEAGQRSRVSRR